MDLSKLTSAPWEAVGRQVPNCAFVGDYVLYQPQKNQLVGGEFLSETDADFVALARNAFDVMMWRGWGVLKCDDGWQAVMRRPASVTGINSMIIKDNPFSALVEADKWYRENVELANSTERA